MFTKLSICRSGTFFILFYNWTFVVDLGGVSLAEIKNTSLATAASLESEKKQLLH